MADPAAPKPEAPQIEDTVLLDIVLEKALAGAPFSAKEIRDLVGNANFSKKLIVQRLEQGSGADDPGILTRLIDADVLSLDAGGSCVLKSDFSGLSLADFKKKVLEVLNPPAPASTIKELSSRINANEADVLADAPVNPDDIDFDVAAAKGNGAFAFWVDSINARPGLLLPFTKEQVEKGQNIDVVKKYYAAFEVKDKVLSGLLSITNGQLKKLGIEIPDSVLDPSEISGAISTTLEEFLITRPQVILSIDLFLKNSVANLSEIEKLKIEIEKKKKDLKEAKEDGHASHDLSRTNEEARILPILLKMGSRKTGITKDPIEWAVLKGESVVNSLASVFGKKGKLLDLRYSTGIPIIGLDFGALTRTDKEEEALMAYKDLLRERAKENEEHGGEDDEAHRVINKESIISRLNSVSEERLPAGEKESQDLAILEQKLIVAMAALESVDEEVKKKLGIVNFVESMVEETVDRELTELIRSVSSEEDEEKREKGSSALASIEKLRESLSDSLDPAVEKLLEDAIEEISKLIKQGVAKETAEVTAIFDARGKERLEVSLKGLMDPLKTKDAKIFGMEREEYKNFLIQTLQIAAQAAKNAKNTGKASTIELLVSDIKKK